MGWQKLNEARKEWRIRPQPSGEKSKPSHSTG
jgi:hypothetical protein